MSSIISTKLIRMLDGYATDFESGMEDWDLFVRCALSGAVAQHLPFIGYHYTKALVSRSTDMVNNADLILMRSLGKNIEFPYSLKSRIQVFLVIPFLPRIGGVEKYVKSIMEDLSKYGLRVCIVVTEIDAFGYFDDISNFRSSGNLIIARKDYPDDKTFFEALKVLRLERSVAINFGSPFAFINAQAFCSIFAVNVSFVFNTEISLERTLAWQSYFDEYWIAYEGIKTSFPETLQKNIYTMYTGITEGDSHRRSDKLRKDFNIGFLGRLSPEKNPFGFLDIARNSLDIPELKFIIGGEGPMLDQVKSECYGLPNVNFVGYVSNPFDFLKDIDCLIIPSVVEGIPLVAMEALSQGIPIISTDVGGISELLTSENNGFLWNGKPKEAVRFILKIKNEGLQTATLDRKFTRSVTSRELINRIHKLLDE